MDSLNLLVKETRLRFWNRLLDSAELNVEDIDRELLRETRACSMDEKSAFTLLRACTALHSEGTQATRRVLRTALFFWFSNAGSQREEEMNSLDAESADILELMGRGLSWKEAAQLTGSNPNDYSAYHRFLDKLKQECAKQWTHCFGAEGAEQFERG